MKKEQIIEILDKKETADMVLGVLNDFHLLPTNLGQYIVAGGSVAAILNYIVNGVNYKINDIDVYTWQMFPESASEIIIDSSNSLTGYSMVDSEFAINRVEQPNPKLDIIDIKSASSETEREIKLTDIISTFDLNCTKVAVSPKEIKIYYTEEFVDFLTTRQIELNKISLGSILRALRKSDELNSYFDLYKASILIYERKRQPLDHFEVMEACSKACYQKHEKYTSRLNPHIEIKTWDGDFYYPEANIKDHPLKFAFDAMEIWHYNVSSKLIISLYDRITKNKSQYYRDIFREFIKRENLNIFLFSCPKDYIGTNPETSKMDTLDKYLGKHRILAGILTKYDYNQQLNIMSVMNKLESKYGRKAIGIIESNSQLFTAEGLNIGKAIRLIEEKVQEQKTPLVKKRLPEITCTSTTIKELVTINDLESEGSDMQHCVGGYGGNLKSNSSRIISLQDKLENKIRSTLQLAISNNNGKMVFKINQHYSRQNKPPTYLQKKIAEEFVNILNERELVYEEYNNEVIRELDFIPF